MRNTDDNLARLGDALHGAAVADLDPASAPAAQPAAPSRRRRGRRLALAAAALAAVTAALIISSSGEDTPAAYAVETQPGGGVKIEIYSLSDPKGVERALAEAGVASQVNYLEAGMVCREPHYKPSMALLRTLQDGQPQPQPWAGFNYETEGADGPLTIAIGDYQQRQQISAEQRDEMRQGDYHGASWPGFVIDPNGFKPDQTLILTSAPAPPGYRPPAPPNPGPGIRIKREAPTGPITVGQIRVAEGDVGACEPVPAAAAGGMDPAIRAPEGGWNFSQTPYAGWGFGFPGPGGSK
ncbi:MAG: hypothetical protein JST31_03145 [Actinobacteria bacterium]|nr:hypothetical protein [Actinomycetota bacterium]